MGCPNDDPSFSKLLDTIIGSSTPQTREKLFYFVCIFVRLFIFVTLVMFKDHKWLPYIVGVIALLASLKLANDVFILNNKDAWWSKKLQCVMALMLCIVCVLVIYKKINTLWMPLIFFVSLAMGIIQSLFITFC